MPGGLTTEVKLLEVHGDFVEEAQAGDIVAFSVTASSLPVRPFCSTLPLLHIVMQRVRELPGSFPASI